MAFCGIRPGQADRRCREEPAPCSGRPRKRKAGVRPPKVRLRQSARGPGRHQNTGYAETASSRLGARAAPSRKRVARSLFCARGILRTHLSVFRRNFSPVEVVHEGTTYVAEHEPEYSFEHPFGCRLHRVRLADPASQETGAETADAGHAVIDQSSKASSLWACTICSRCDHSKTVKRPSWEATSATESR
jgi:hypothetical protein